MRYIWSPWRMKYIMKHAPSTGCVFCNAASEADGPENLIIHRGNRAFVILNRYPYTSGHLMVVPYMHEPSFEGLDVETRTEIMELMNEALKVVRQIYQPEGINVGANLGSAAGAGIAAHVHLHVVPRWVGDTNFMTAVGDARVLPEDVTESYTRFKKIWSESE
jgi:ATP adenylyltransferase